ncbi:MULTISPECIES: type II secretion system F family protein [Streptomycetaceae]|uniref:Integral membrane protein n=1 Tax=Streptantibioticus cattleyicolor (strain ATCC 35852 / DSM 46488 / JCM 4925 / NBRC 14057 / NRRL 8057) TaxID=1003195 RepID=F8JP77_STREN|nr:MULTISPECIES: type II secretion system F family protein [Streptomycetaceae]AEW95227.1 integral membrane protein [Streptantibioticus cattleyicolor NRRL 8057 = DSM 46488]MYS59808.1 hypothetical protein [Streptomyces sp. SID5468]CCB75572.1 Integral membrane protein [Streptantibioticus cattleyicolor NRRL 8057 = DSM 46488]
MTATQGQIVAAWCAVVGAVAAVLSLRRQEETLRRARLLLAPGAVPPAGPSSPAAWVRDVLVRARARVERRYRVRLGHELWCLPAGLALGLAGRSPLPVVAAVFATPYVGRALRIRRRAAAMERRQRAVAELCATVAGDLRAGRPPDAALADAVERSRALGPAASGGWVTPLLAAARFGGDVAGALRTASRQPGAQGLAAVAACWEVAVDGGAGLADGLDRLAAALRAELDQHEDLRAQLAGPRATAVLLALLPALGLGLGWAMGADPFGVLLRTPPGLGCLAVGGALEWAGLAWTARIVRAAQDAAGVPGSGAA